MGRIGGGVVRPRRQRIGCVTMPGGIAGGPAGCGSSRSVRRRSRYTGRCWNASGAGGVETTYIELPKALQALGQECFVFCRCEAEHVVDGVRFVPWERMAEYADLNPDVLVTSRWFDPLYWPALAGAKKVLWLQDAYFADPGRAFEVVDRVVVSSPWHRDYTVQRYGHGIDARKLRVINLGIRRELFGGSGRAGAGASGMQAVYSSNPDRGLQELAAMWPEIVAARAGAAVWS